MFWIEIIATGFGVLCVVLTIRRNIWCWPTGLIQVLLFIVIFYDAKLYSDLILHVIYVGMQLYGWHVWRNHGVQTEDGSIRVLTMPRFKLVSWTVITAAGTLLLGAGMQRWTDASVPYGDAFTTVASLVAQYLLARKHLENWLFWIVVDVIAIGIYVQKSLLATAVLYSVFLVLAIIGYLTWRQKMREPEGSAESSA